MLHICQEEYKCYDNKGLPLFLVFCRVRLFVFIFPKTDEGKKVNICSEFIYFNFIWSEKSRVLFSGMKQIRIFVFAQAFVKTKQDDFSINDVQANTKNKEIFNILHFLSSYKATSFSLVLQHCFHFKIYLFSGKNLCLFIHNEARNSIARKLHNHCTIVVR